MKVLSSQLFYSLMLSVTLSSVVLPLGCIASPSSSTVTKSLSDEQQRRFLRSVAPTIRSFRDFGANAKLFKEIGIVKCEPPGEISHRLVFAEFFETLARQSGTSVHYDSKSNNWVFEKPPMPLPYTITMADGWSMEDRGLDVAYISSIGPVGLYIYLLGRFVNLDDQQLEEIRNEEALTWGDKASSGITIADMSPKTVDGCEALYFKTNAPAKYQQWRQWVFVKNKQAFLILSTIDDKNETILMPDVEKMVSSFHVIEPAVPFPGFEGK
jgi:hypothetical protein